MIPIRSLILLDDLRPHFHAPSSVPRPSFLPARILLTVVEAWYTGLYKFSSIISIISFSPRGMIAELWLERDLKRMNADNYVLNGEKTEVFKRMEREGYIVKVRERNGGEGSLNYVVCLRGKAEVGQRGVMG